MRNYVRSLLIVVPRLRFFYLVVFLLAASSTVWCAYTFVTRNPQETPSQGRLLLEQILIYGGGALVGLSASGYFSCAEQFLVRGITDAVYLVENCFLSPPRIRALANRETLDAFGSKWYEIVHVSERMMTHFYNIFRGHEIDLKKADLFRMIGTAESQASVYAVLSGTRYGIPDPPTLYRIWGNKKVAEIDVSQLDAKRPGRDLVSVEYWPKNDQGN